MPAEIPANLRPYFQEYDIASLDVIVDADLIIQRTLEFGNWEETRWLFQLYGMKRVRAFLRKHGERWLHPMVFNYWRKLFGIRKWERSPFITPRSEIWPF